LTKTAFIHSKTKNTLKLDCKLLYENKIIANLFNTKYLGLCLHNTLDWRGHIDYIIPNAWYAIRTLKQMMSQETLIIIHCTYCHSLMAYGIIFWGNSPYSIHIFKLQEKIIRTITISSNRASCRNLFKNLNIFSFISQYIFSLLWFVIMNKEQYIINLNMHGRNIRYSSNIHQTISNCLCIKEVLIKRGSRFLLIVCFYEGHVQ
jgi:hypothetical protein